MARPATPRAENPTLAQQVQDTYAAIRARKIRAARARVPQPTYQQIALELGVCERTVYNVLHEKTHAAP